MKKLKFLKLSAAAFLACLALTGCETNCCNNGQKKSLFGGKQRSKSNNCGKAKCKSCYCTCCGCGFTNSQPNR